MPTPFKPNSIKESRAKKKKDVKNNNLLLFGNDRFFPGKFKRKRLPIRYPSKLKIDAVNIARKRERRTVCEKLLKTSSNKGETNRGII